MIKRVKLDESGWLTEIDWKATCRVAHELKDYIEAAPLGEVMQYEYKERVMPLIAKTLSGSIKLPHKGDCYDTRAIMDGFYPELNPIFSRIYSQFICMIWGSISCFSLSVYESGHFIPQKYRKKDKFGDVYEMCWFED